MSATPDDVVTLDNIIAALYEAVSGPAGVRDWDRMRSLFWPGARLIPTRRNEQGGAYPHVLSVEEFIVALKKNTETEGFYERELSRKVESFGHITHVFSAYECKHSPQDSAPFMRGINSIQLFFDGARFGVLTIFWDIERPENSLPTW